MPPQINRLTNPSLCYRKHKNVKKCAYETQIQEIEYSSIAFTTLVMSINRRPGPASTYTAHDPHSTSQAEFRLLQPSLPHTSSTHPSSQWRAPTAVYSH